MSDILDLEHEIKQAEGYVARKEMAVKLSQNHEFRKLIEEEYFTNEATRLIRLSVDTSRSPQERADAVAAAQSTGHLKLFLSTIYQIGAVAERELPKMREALEELRAAEHDVIGDDSDD